MGTHILKIMDVIGTFPNESGIWHPASGIIEAHLAKS